MKTMSVRELIPWKRNRSVPVQRAAGTAADVRDPFLALHREMNRLFEDFWSGFGSFGGFGLAGAAEGWSAPTVDLVETDDGYRLTAELPGVDEKDIEVLIADNTLTVRGEKKNEYEDRERALSERFYGRFERRIPLPTEVQEDRVEASFRNGVLTVTLPRSAKAQSARRIPLKAA